MGTLNMTTAYKLARASPLSSGWSELIFKSLCVHSVLAVWLQLRTHVAQTIARLLTFSPDQHNLVLVLKVWRNIIYVWIQSIWFWITEMRFLKYYGVNRSESLCLYVCMNNCVKAYLLKASAWWTLAHTYTQAQEKRHGDTHHDDENYMCASDCNTNTVTEN